MTTRVVGLGGVTAFGRGVDALWRGARSGVAATQTNTTFGGTVVGQVPLPLAREEDRALAWARLAAREAIEGAGWSARAISDPRTALLVGTTKAGIGLAERVLSRELAAYHLADYPLFALGRRLADELRMTGLVETLSVACASGIVIAGHAAHLLRSGRADRVLAVGCDALSQFIVHGFTSLRCVDPSGARPFDSARAGLSVGEGAAAIALEPGAGPALACLTGYGAVNDAHHITGPARDGRGLVAAMRRALYDAGVAAQDVGMIAAHGTGTRHNDAMEGEAYAAVFGANAVPVHSIKGAVGHTLGAAGLINVVLAVRALQEQVCPPVAGLVDPDPDIRLQLVRAHEQPIDTGHAIACAAGFAGANAVAVLSTAPRSSARRARRRVAITGAVSVDTGRSALVAAVGLAAARRLDEVCLAGLSATGAALAAAGLGAADVDDTAHAVILGTALGCLESDHAFYEEVRELGLERASPRLFAYTLPSVVLGEVAIAHKLMGEQIVFSAGRASGLTALAEASSLVASGSKEWALVLVVDVVGEGARRLYGALGREPVPFAGAIVLESEDRARRRGADIMSWVSHEHCSSAARSETRDGGPDLLGASGVAALIDALSARRGEPIRASCLCPTGYTAEVEISA